MFKTDKIVLQLMGTPNLSSSSTSTNSDTDKSSDSSLQNSITSVSSEEEDEDPLLFPLMHHLITGRKRHRKLYSSYRFMDGTRI